MKVTITRATNSKAAPSHSIYLKEIYTSSAALLVKQMLPRVCPPHENFTAQLSRIHEQHADEIQRLVETFRKKNSELRNER
ncbi:hypothetical protein E2C01_045142 [Portunus trituberculatus]|uniref:Uncharacterized protein n=1 Tax=Portunus trituberculatus TaxID=210409 RepID=A0A5B7G0Z9_PORTR|nr:hypothetical protein [Portunus trituberculatus]